MLDCLAALVQRTPLAGGGAALERWLATETENALAGVGIRVKWTGFGLGDEDRIAVVLWCTHGALPPRVSDALVLRCLCAAPASEAARVLRVSEPQLLRLVTRAARRTRALGLGLRSVGPCEQRLALKVAEQRLRGLLRQASRVTGEDPLPAVVAVLEDWLELVGASRTRRRGGR